MPETRGSPADLLRVLQSSEAALNIERYSVSQATLEQVGPGRRRAARPWGGGPLSWSESLSGSQKLRRRGMGVRRPAYRLLSARVPVGRASARPPWNWASCGGPPPRPSHPWGPRGALEERGLVSEESPNIKLNRSFIPKAA